MNHGEKRDTPTPQDRLVLGVKWANGRKGDYTLFSVLSNILDTECFKQKDSVLNTSAITAVAKSSMHEAKMWL